MDNSKSFYVAGSLLGIAHKHNMEFFYTIDVFHDIVEGVFYDFDTSKTEYIKCCINEMTDINGDLDRIENHLMDRVFNESKYVHYKTVKDESDRSYKKLANKFTGELLELKNLHITNVIFNDPATIVFWSDGTKTVVKTKGNDKFDPEKGLAMAISKKHMGNADGWYKDFKKWLPEDDELTRMTKELESIKEKIRQARERMNSNFDNLQIKGFCPNPTVEGDIKDLFDSMSNDQKESVYRYVTELINNNIQN